MTDTLPQLIFIRNKRHTKLFQPQSPQMPPFQLHPNAQTKFKLRPTASTDHRVSLNSLLLSNHASKISHLILKRRINHALSIGLDEISTLITLHSSRISTQSRNLLREHQKTLKKSLLPPLQDYAPIRNKRFLGFFTKAHPLN